MISSTLICTLPFSSPNSPPGLGLWSAALTSLCSSAYGDRTVPARIKALGIVLLEAADERSSKRYQSQANRHDLLSVIVCSRRHSGAAGCRQVGSMMPAYISEGKSAPVKLSNISQARSSGSEIRPGEFSSSSSCRRMSRRGRRAIDAPSLGYDQQAVIQIQQS